MLLRLIRKPPDDLAVRGRLYFVTYDVFSEEEVLPLLCPTLENRLYLIPPGRYRLTVTYSPKFQRDLPLVNNVPNRSAIRFHPGSKPEHSRGCILISRHDEQHLTDFIRSEKVVLLEIK